MDPLDTKFFTVPLFGKINMPCTLCYVYLTEYFLTSLLSFIAPPAIFQLLKLDKLVKYKFAPTYIHLICI